MIPARIMFWLLVAATAGWSAGRIYSWHRAAAAQAASAVPAASAAPATLAVQPESDASPEQAYLTPAATIPARLPSFTLEDQDGKPTPIGTWGGKSLILNFWATWCAPCRREIPLLETLRADWRPEGFEVIGIAVDNRPEVLDFARRMHIDYPVLIGEQDALDVAAALGFDSPAFPFTVFTDRRSRIVALFVGELHPPQAKLILSTVQRVNAGQLEIGAARSAISTGLHDLH